MRAASTFVSCCAVVVAALAFSACTRPPELAATKVLDLHGLDENLRAIAIAPEGDFVITSDMDGSLSERKIADGSENWRVIGRERDPGSGVDTLVISPDGSVVAVAGNEALALELRDTGTGDQIGTLPIHGARAIAFDPTGTKLVAGESSCLQVIDVSSLKVERSLPDAHLGDPLHAAAFSADGKVLATASFQGLVRLWDWPALTLRTSFTMKSPKLREAPALVSVALSHDGALCAANAGQGEVDVWDAAQKRLVRKIANEATAPGNWHIEMVRSLVFSDDGRWLFAPGVHDGGMRVVDWSSGKSCALVHENVPYFKGVAFSSSVGLVALIHPSQITGKGPDGLEVWKIGAAAP